MGKKDVGVNDRLGFVRLAGLGYILYIGLILLIELGGRGGLA